MIFCSIPHTTNKKLSCPTYDSSDCMYKTSSTITNDFSCNSDDQILVGNDTSYDYCFIDIDDDNHRRDNDVNNFLSEHDSFPLVTDISDEIYIRRFSNENIRSDTKIIFTFNIRAVPMACRSFSCPITGLHYTQLTTLVTAFRIMQDESGEYPEFHVVICVDRQQYCVWRRLSQFGDLIRAADIVASESASRRNDDHKLRQSKRIWNSLTQKGYWWSRNLSIKFLAWKTLRLGDFLREILFEIPTPMILGIFLL